MQSTIATRHGMCYVLICLESNINRALELGVVDHVWCSTSRQQKQTKQHLKSLFLSLLKKTSFVKERIQDSAHIDHNLDDPLPFKNM